MTQDVLVSAGFDAVLVFKNLAHYVVNNGAVEVDGCSVGLGGHPWVDALGLHKEGSCGGNVAMSGVFVSRFEVNQLHEGFGDCRVDEVYVGCAVLDMSTTMWYGVGCGSSGGR